MANEAIKIVHLRNEFYRDNYRRVLLILLLSIVINLGLGGMLYYIVSHPPKPQYFATSVNGRITKLTPLNKPNQSDASVKQWANQAAIAAYSFDWVNYKSQLEAGSQFFTASGWRKFVRALANSNTIDLVKAKHLIASAVAVRTPIILEKGVLNGRYAWRVQMTVLVTFESASVFSQFRNVITLLVSRVSTLNSPRGIGISQFVANPQGGGITG